MPWWSRAWTVAIFCAALASALMVARAVTSSRAELTTAQSFRHADQSARAIEHYRRALRWSFPLSPYTAGAVSGLQECASELEAQGHISEALLAWRSLVGGLSATRSLFWSPASPIEHAKAQIARLEALQAETTGGNLAESRNEYRSKLDARVAPHRWWAVLLLVGFTTWIVSLFSLSQRGFDEQGRFRWADARFAVWSAAAGFAAFAAGLALA